MNLICLKLLLFYSLLLEQALGVCNGLQHSLSDSVIQFYQCSIIVKTHSFPAFTLYYTVQHDTLYTLNLDKISSDQKRTWRMFVSILRTEDTHLWTYTWNCSL